MTGSYSLPPCGGVQERAARLGGGSDSSAETAVLTPHQILCEDLTPPQGGSGLSGFIAALQQEFGLIPVVGLEIEFYLPVETPLAQIDALADSAWFLPAEEERGQYQYEIASQPSADLDALSQATEALRQRLTTQLGADFRARPFAEDYGSALHFHLHLQDAAGVNAFTRDPQTSEYSDALLHSIGGLLHHMPQQLAIFSPHDRTRFSDPNWHSPTRICWGPNNRSVALRLPDSPAAQKRIEHRLAAADAGISECIAAILQGALHGLRHQTTPSAPIYGNAWDAQYGLASVIKL